MPKIQTATAAGNRFVLTSRRHIYEAAKPKLGSRNHPLFRDGRAVVEVGALTIEERRQILYNHVKSGAQPLYWKQHVSRVLNDLAEELLLTPEIARQIGDPNYTAKIAPNKQALQWFIRRNKAHLLQTIRELSKPHRAALTLVFIHGGLMPVGAPVPEMQSLVTRHYNIDSETLAEALIHLKGSFIVEKIDGIRRDWAFKHPTLADALAATLGEADGMRELYLRGVNAETILSDVLCEGVNSIQDAVMVPATLNELLLRRLLEVKDDAEHANGLLFSFLARRASETVLRAFVEADPNVFRRPVKNYYYYSAHHSRVQFFARAHRIGILPEFDRIEIVSYLEYDIFERLDTSILSDEETLSLFPPRQLMALPRRIKDELLPSIEEKIESIAEEADLELEPRENFGEISSNLSDIETFFEGDADGTTAYESASASLESAIDQIGEKKEAEKRRAARDDWNWNEYVSSQPSTSSTVKVAAEPLPSPRSMFSDVAE